MTFDNIKIPKKEGFPPPSRKQIFGKTTRGGHTDPPTLLGLT